MEVRATRRPRCATTRREGADLTSSAVGVAHAGRTKAPVGSHAAYVHHAGVARRARHPRITAGRGIGRHASASRSPTCRAIVAEALIPVEIIEARGSSRARPAAGVRSTARRQRGGGRRGGTARTRARRRAGIAATRTASDAPPLRGTVRAVLLDLAGRALGRGEAAGDRVRLAAGRMGRTLLDEPGAARVREHSVRLLHRAVHVGAVLCSASAVAVGRDCGTRVRDVRAGEVAVVGRTLLRAVGRAHAALTRSSVDRSRRQPPRSGQQWHTTTRTSGRYRRHSSKPCSSSWPRLRKAKVRPSRSTSSSDRCTTRSMRDGSGSSSVGRPSTGSSGRGSAWRPSRSWWPSR